MNFAQDKKVQAVDAPTLKQWLDERAVVLLDVREAAEHAGEKIPGAVHAALSTFHPQQLPQDRKVVFHCQSGKRSAQAAQKLLDAGSSEAIHLQGGILAWKQAGYLTEINYKAPVSMMRQVQMVAGSLVLTGVALGTLVAPPFFLLSAFVGAGLVFSGVTNTCAMAALLAKLPYNQQK
jgi:rhodanese-related sulfurtransferase